MPTTAEDFHGDGVDGEVAVVWADRLLRHERDSMLLEEKGESSLMVAREACDLLSPLRAPFEFSLARALTPPGDIGVARPAFPFGYRGEGEADGVGFGVRARRDTTVDESMPDSGAGYLKALRDGQFTDASEVFLDDVVGVEVQSFHGEVFNFETKTHLFVAEGIVVGNCWCALEPEWATAKDGITLEELDQLAEPPPGYEKRVRSLLDDHGVSTIEPVWVD